MKTIKTISLVFLMIFSITSHKVQAQDCNNAKILHHKQFDEKTLDDKWNTYIKNPGFKVLLDEVKKQGFKRAEKIAWGFDA